MSIDNNLASCKLCGKNPSVSMYETDGGGGTSNQANLSCECGNEVVKYSKDYEGCGKTGWDICESQWKQALRDAKSDWNFLNVQ